MLTFKEEVGGVGLFFKPQTLDRAYPTELTGKAILKPFPLLQLQCITSPAAHSNLTTAHVYCLQQSLPTCPHSP